MRKYIIDGEEYEPIVMGAVGDFDEGCDADETCHDCGCAVGEQHMMGCDAERCPSCGGQFISCDCDIQVQEENSELKEMYDKTPCYTLLGKDYKLKEKEDNFKKPKAPIIGADGNVFNLMGICRQSLKRAGFEEKAKEMTDRIQNCGSYEDALNIMQEYIIPTYTNHSDEEM